MKKKTMRQESSRTLSLENIARSSTKQMCMPGGRLDDISAAYDEATSVADINVQVRMMSWTPARRSCWGNTGRWFDSISVKLAKPFLQELFPEIMHTQHSSTGPSALTTVLNPFVQRKASISSTAGMAFITNVLFSKTIAYLNPVWSCSFW